MDRIYVMQLVRSFQAGEISRRAFLRRTTAAVGSLAVANVLLAACQPVTTVPRPVVDPTATGEGVGSTATNQTTGAGLVTGVVEYAGPDGETLTGYLARPEGDGAWPALVVIQEWWGLNEHIKDVARRFAAEGFVVLAPDLYHGQVATEPDEARKLVMEIDMAAAVEEIQSGIDYLLAQDTVKGDQVGVTGFCFGGRLALMTALADATVGQVAAVAPFYGSPLTPEEAAQLKTPLLGSYGADDGGIPVAGVKAMGDAMTAAGIDNDIKIYAGAPHAFFNDTRSSYRPEAAADAWQRVLAFFRQYLSA